MTVIYINTASTTEIDAIEPLKGHGFEIARYRQERDGFTELRQLDEVPVCREKPSASSDLSVFGVDHRSARRFLTR